ncbi:hypothetical protein N1937_00970 [Rhizobium sp. WSM4643]|nr:hypothetical protein [Rhizobium leguminosarum]UWM78103.1 hypothetical protein N1937_00970 [Rhizobium leguminosarum bv. viciae]
MSETKFLFVRGALERTQNWINLGAGSVLPMRDDQASVLLDDVGFLHLAAVLVDEIMREGGTNRRFGEFGARLATISDASGVWVRGPGRPFAAF